MRTTSCLICGAQDNFDVLYPENFNAADLTGTMFSARHLPDQVHFRIVRCRADGLVRSNPVLPFEEAVKLYRQSVVGYEEEIAPLTMTYMRALRPVLAELDRDARILEVGCGNGFMLQAIKAAGFTHIFGMEPSRDAAGKADASVRDSIVCDVLRPGLWPKGSFDLIYVFQTLDHIYDPESFLKECRDLLKPGGKILAFQHDSDSWSARLLGEKNPIIDIQHIYLFNERTIPAVFKRFGFEPLKVYKPWNILSLRHLFWLVPMPKAWKIRLTQPLPGWLTAVLRIRVCLPLGNLSIIAQRK